MDVLSEVLKVVQLRGALFYNGEFSSPWCVNASSARALLPYTLRVAVGGRPVAARPAAFFRLLGSAAKNSYSPELDIDWETAQTAPLEALVNSLAMGLPFEPAEKQALLEAPTLSGRSGAAGRVVTLPSP